MRIEYLRSLGLSDVDATAEAQRRSGDTVDFRVYARQTARRALRIDPAEALRAE